MKLENEKKSLEIQLQQMTYNWNNLKQELEKITVLLEERKKERNDALKTVFRICILLC